ncbi:MAG TPA: hypothetical protein VN203_01960, partial [Candidatus Acidoferrum sp.]|nr:hypothetical protein [Candidatus Acidoferrum sp.]
RHGHVHWSVQGPILTESGLPPATGSVWQYGTYATAEKASRLSSVSRVQVRHDEAHGSPHCHSP